MKWIVLVAAVLMLSGCFWLDTGFVEYRPQAVAVVPAPLVPLAPVNPPVASRVAVPIAARAVAPGIKPVAEYRYPNGSLRYITTSIDYW